MKIILCDYGCNQHAKYQFKNGRWCCSLHQNSCPYIKEKMKLQLHRKEKRSVESKKKQSNTMIENGSTKGEKNGMYGRHGKNNPFYNKTHTDEQKKIWKKVRSSKQYKCMMSELMKCLWREKWFFESHTKYTQLEKENLNKYYKAVANYTRHSIRKYYEYINPNNKPISYYEYHIDHIFSIIDGFNLNILPEIIGSVVNLQILPMKENLQKNRKSDITKEELLERFKNNENNL